jgi:cellobiose phosphorylase
MHTTKPSGWQFIDNQGTFELMNPQQYSYLYFPLINLAGMMSCITPGLNGDAKTGQNTFLLLPVSVEDLHNTRSARNFWVRINGEPWSVTGNSAAQISQNTLTQPEKVILKAGFLWHYLERHHATLGLRSEVLNFVPVANDPLEVMQVTLSNQGTTPLDLTPTAAIPIYGRSADNLRDHRHVTALFHRINCHQYGVMVKPSISFDERGHKENHVVYAVLGFDGDGNPPQGFTPLVKDFIGEGGSLDWPKAIVAAEPDLEPFASSYEGYEAMGGIHFLPIHLQPGESRTYILLLGIYSGDADIDGLIDRYGSEEKINAHFDATKKYWQQELSSLHFDHQEDRFDGWLKWVNLQPTLRRIMGNSFLPYHDYGKGGRGWRDLWQDLLAPLLTDAIEMRPLLVENFAGVRMDGSHATILGHKPGEFFADRNSIPRVWMDHGAWPLLTIMLYLNMTGDLDLLLKKQTYFKDHLTHRCQKSDELWRVEHGTVLKTVQGEVAYGTIFEHLLVQHLTTFFNVGAHNIIRLEGGDWNDGLDMASDHGESVAFSALYAGNLRKLSALCLSLVASGIDDVEINQELLHLLDSDSETMDYQSIDAKQTRLQAYMDCVAKNLSGKKIRVSLRELSIDLKEKANWLSKQICKGEWVTDKAGLGWFNGYYDNLGERVEGDHPQGVRMTLTGQVFPLMADLATPSQARQVVSAADCYLFDEGLNGYRLNTDFKGNLPELGRAFWFAYGHKENGSVFSHMNAMFANALYRQGLAQEAWKILDGLYTQSQKFSKSRMYPGLPEYFDPCGRGVYPYLTGSAAWYIYTLLTESFGIKGQMGDLTLAPKLVAAQFTQSDQLKVKTRFANKTIEITYHNSQHLSYGDYYFKGLTVNGVQKPLTTNINTYCFPRSEVSTWSDPVQISVVLA